jgi:putative pyruvate formate lyase activating enzyme
MTRSDGPTIMTMMLNSGRLHYQAVQARDMLARCRLCGQACGARREAGEKGLCGAGAEVLVAAHLLHFGEEPPISGSRGSGTIFFSGCPLYCVFCQNYQISHEKQGRAVSTDELSAMMLDLQDQGAHNINLVSPTPWIPQILSALSQALDRGLNLPVVYNTGGYDSPAALGLLEGVVDIYLPDAKYASDESARQLSGIPNYVAVNRAALKEMYRQVGRLSLNREGLAEGGLLVRHLVLPNDAAGTGPVLKWLAGEFGSDIFVSLMSQYRPCHLVQGHPEDYPDLSRPLTEEEYDAALDQAMALDMENVFIQELSSSDTYVPDFGTEEVFGRTG